jgi:hypothetical protein
VATSVARSQRRASLEVERRLSGMEVGGIGVGDEIRFALREAFGSLDEERRRGAQSLKRATEAYLDGDMD